MNNISSQVAQQRHKKYRYVFTSKEDQILQSLVSNFGTNDWELISQHLPGRTPRQCKERWFTYLSPEVNRTALSPDEDALLFDLLQKYGRKWGSIVCFFQNRTQNNVKNRWNTIVRKAKSIGLDPNNRSQFVETGQRIACRSIRNTFELPIHQKAEIIDPVLFFSISNLINHH